MGEEEEGLQRWIRDAETQGVTPGVKALFSFSFVLTWQSVPCSLSMEAN